MSVHRAGANLTNRSRVVGTVLFAASLAAVACSSSSSPATPTTCVESGATFACGEEPNAITSSSLPCFVEKLPHNNEFAVLTPDKLGGVTNAARSLADGDLAAARMNAAGVGFRVVRLRTPGECYWVMQPTSGAPPGQATLIVRDAWTRDLVLEAPHVPFDRNTDMEAALIFQSVKARALVVAGAQRCASNASSGCHPNSQCGGRPVESDASHSTRSAFHAMHLGLATSPRATTAVQFHTNVDEGTNGDALVSNGTRGPSARIQKFYDALMAHGITPRTCNDPAHPAAANAYCGTTNAQGLASNGAADACTGATATASDSFVHLEQHSRKLDKVADWAASVGGAIADAIPTTR